ncbi:hemolysin family protein [Breznakiella homolactica]|uniref:HlyC/CorC family transporter n=1 Tax=Breznakiella homolactica TaxID=2798577 RepID=A0A7T8BAL1_9SPIR|nr:hemolysin family protein [Breznakiella homolactica]QQO08328.1 hemolysin family protein [Breznakiella homolactica]
MNTDDPPLSGILIILGLIILGGFFSLAEAAVLSSRKSRIRSKFEGGEKQYRKILALIERPGPFLSAIQVCITLLGIVSGALGAIMLAEPLAGYFARRGLFGSYDLTAACVIIIAGITLLYTVFGEMVPKKIALANPEKIASRLAPILSALAVFFKPLVFILTGISGLILRLFRINDTPSAMTEDELRTALIEGEKSGIVESEERTMVEGVFYLGDRPVSAFMTHRSEIEWLNINAGADEAKELARESADQRYFPVATESLDNVVGVVLVEDILLALLDNRWNGLKAIMKSPPFIPETMSALKAFESFKKGDADILFIMDEYGGFAGTLSVRDLVEEIVGELSTDNDEEEILLQDDGTYLVDGVVNIDDLAETLCIEDMLGEHHEYHTLAGFILELAEKIPKTGEVYEWNGFRFKIVDMDGNRIDKVIVYPPAEQAGSAAAQ